MKTSEMTTQAVGVVAEGVVDIVDGDSVLVGVKCVYRGGKFIPITEGFKFIKGVFDLCDRGELVIIKRIKKGIF